MALFMAILLLSFSTFAVESISLADTVAKNNQKLLPASRLVDFRLFQVQADSYRRQHFEHSHLPSIKDNPSASFSSLLKRRDGLSIYRKDIIHGPEEPNYATLSLLPMTKSAGTMCKWEAIMLLTPTPPIQLRGESCFVAMNRFAVKEGCQYLFEQRRAERQSKLASQPGFLSFCLIRKQNNDNEEKQVDDCISASLNYSSLTLWASFEAWTNWREGDGRYSHDASRAAKRTPVREWLEYPASPIFWDGTGTIMTESGL